MAKGVKRNLLAWKHGPWYGEAVPKPRKDPVAKYAALFASLGGKARAKRLTPEQRREIARKAALARWRKS